MPGKGTVDAISIMWRMQKEFKKKVKKLYMCFVGMEKAFDRMPREVMEKAIRKKDLSEVMVRAVLSLYDGAKIRVRVGSVYSEKFQVKVGVHQGTVLSLLLFVIAVDLITKNARRNVVDELLRADDLVIIAKPCKTLRKDFGIGRMQWKVMV